jgi:DNA topoisomerase-1
MSASSLLVVESPTKVRTLKKYLGAEFDIRASVGHVKDLPKKTLGIDPAKDFEPTYEVIPEKKKVIAELKKAAKAADRIFLAPDPDREGEAIAWHIAEEIKAKGKPVQRVLFNDLTKSTVLEALNHPRDLDVNKFDAQQTRRTLDRLVGYQISPILWDKVKRGLSAGRVQSVAVRLVCDREEEIRRFVAEEYWLIAARLQGKLPPAFEAKLLKIDGKKARIENGETAAAVVETLRSAEFRVAALERKELKRSPLPPFTTSKLQQEASRWLHFSAKKTMSVAQRLYEGVELGPEGPVGLITYMRTDSVRISDEALREAREYIRDNYDSAYLPPKPRVFKVSGSAQDAHEAIRPSSMKYRPQDIKGFLTPDQFRLYQLIWNRFTASQMNPAIFDQTTLDVAAANCLLRAQGSILKFPGFTIVYTEGKEDNGAADDEIGHILPDLAPGDPVDLLEVKSEQKFTLPPPRFSEASLVRELEEKGIGRPSTYASILSTIQDRGYVRLETGRFHPTDLGAVVNELLVKNFPRILDVEFTAGLEKQLDGIEEGNQNRLETLRSFYGAFEEELKKAKSEMRNIKREETPTDQICEKCGSPMVIKWGRNGRFVACSNYPDCKNTRNLQPNGDPAPAASNEEAATGKVCEKCGKPMLFKQGRFGRFLGCSGYPECRSTMPLDLGVACPEPGCTGKISEKRTKKGKTFFSCTNYPTCKFALWNRPVPEPCPSCGAPFLVEKVTRNGGSYRACFRKECKYKSTAPRNE